MCKQGTEILPSHERSQGWTYKKAVPFLGTTFFPPVYTFLFIWSNGKSQLHLFTYFPKAGAFLSFQCLHALLWLISSRCWNMAATIFVPWFLLGATLPPASSNFRMSSLKISYLQIDLVWHYLDVITKLKETWPQATQLFLANSQIKTFISLLSITVLIWNKSLSNAILLFHLTEVKSIRFFFFSFLNGEFS